MVSDPGWRHARRTGTSRKHHGETRLCHLAIVNGGRTIAIVSLADIAARPRASTQNEGDED